MEYLDPLIKQLIKKAWVVYKKKKKFGVNTEAECASVEKSMQAENMDMLYFFFLLIFIFKNFIL